MRLKFLVTLFLMFVLGTVAHAAMLARDGEVFFRYKGGPNGKAPVDTVSPFDADITVRLVGVVDFPLSERIPVIPGKTVTGWEIIDGVIPEGINLDGTTGIFGGTPAKEDRGNEIFLQGRGADGQPNAIARVTFDVFRPNDQLAQVDFYAHTDKFSHQVLPVPDNLTVDHWNVVFAPPPGVTILGKSYDGTPTEAGRYPVAVQGFDYLNREVILLVGYYLVEDGPTFPHIADQVFPIQPEIGGIDWDMWPPRVRAVADPTGYGQFVYELELADGETLPGTISVAPYTAQATGWIEFPYDTAIARYKATDTDGTVGYSNWFTFGSSYSTPYFSSTPLGPFYGVVGDELKLSFIVPGSSGEKTFTIQEGSLPEGLELDAKTGMISGVPTREETQAGIVLHLADLSGGAVSEAVSAPFSIIIDPSRIGIEISFRETPAARGAQFSASSASSDASANTLLLRTGSQVAMEVKGTGGLIEPYSISIDPRYPLPSSMSYEDGIISGTSDEVAMTYTRFVLVNGNGKSTDATLKIGSYAPLNVAAVGDLSIPRYDTLSPAFPINIDPNGLMPSTALGGGAPTVEIVGNAPAGIFYSFQKKGLVGSTKDPEGDYGPLYLAVTDGSGETATSNNFFIHVTPRKSLSVETRDVTLDMSADRVNPIVNVIRPPLAQTLTLTYELAAGTLPGTLAVDSASGEIRGVPSATGTYEGLRIKVTDSEGLSATSAPFKLTVVPAGPLTQVVREDAVVTVDHPANLPATEFKNVVGTLTFDSIDGLPNGLSMDASGAITGIPTELVTARLITVSATDDGGRSATATFKLSVIPQPALAFDPAETVLHVAQYESKSWKLKATNVIGIPAISISKGTLPRGLTLYTTGLLKGVPGNTGSFNVVATVRDSATGLTAELPFQVVVGPRREVSLAYEKPTAFLGFPYPVNPTVNNAKGAVAFTLDAGIAPPGMAFIPATGQFSGIPTQTGLYKSIKVTASDSAGSSGTALIDILVTKLGSITAPASVAYSYRVGETFTTPSPGYDNYVAPIEFSAVSAVPAGLTFNAADGRFSGVLSAAGEVSAAITAEDAHMRHADTNTTVRITAVAGLTVTAEPGNHEIDQYSPTASKIGATFGNLIGAGTYSLTGTLPTGLAFDTRTGEIAGQAAQTGTFANLRIAVTDNHDNAVAQTQPFTITVKPRQPLQATLPTVANTLVNKSIGSIASVSVTNAAYGAQATYAYTGTLPTGIVFDPTSGSFGGTATDLGDFPNIYVTVTDSVGAKATAGPMTMRSILNGAPISLVVQDLTTHVNWNFSTPAPTVTNQVGRMNFYSYDLAPQISLNPATGVMTGRFDSPQDFEFDLYIGDETNRVTSDRLMVKVYPDVQAVYPSTVEVMQYKAMTAVLPQTNYFIGTKKFVRTNPSAWPPGLNLDESTGSITGTPVASGTYDNLAVVATDTIGGQASTSAANIFKIVVDASVERPKIYSINGLNVAPNKILLKVGTPLAAGTLYPYVTNQSNAAWAFGGLTFKINGTLPDGLTMDSSTGMITGTPTATSPYGDFTIEVQDSNGNKSTSSAFQIGVEPTKAMKQTKVSPASFLVRANSLINVAPPTITDAVGVVKFSFYGGTSAFSSVTVDPDTGATAARPLTGAYINVLATDELGRTALEQYTVTMAANVSGYQTEVFAAMGGAYLEGVKPVVSDVVGTASYEYVNLPAGMTYSTSTGIIAGTPTVSGTFSVGLIVRDENSASTQTNFVVNVVNPVKHRYWRIAAANATKYKWLQFIDENGQSHASKVLSGAGTVSVGGAPSDTYKALLDTTSAYQYNAGDGMVVVDFGEPVSVVRAYNVYQNEFLSFWWSDNGTNWTALNVVQEAAPATSNYVIKRRN